MTEYGGGTPTQARSHYSQATELNQPDQIFTGQLVLVLVPGLHSIRVRWQQCDDGRGVSGPLARGHTQLSGCVCCFPDFAMFQK